MMNGRPVSPLRKYLIEHNAIFVLIFSILIGAFISYLAYDVTGHEEIIYLMPFSTFLVMYFLKMKPIKQKLLAGVIIFLVAGIIAAGITSTSYYNSPHPTSYNMYNGAVATLSVDPFGGSGQSYNFSLYVTNLSSPSTFSASLNISNGQNYSFSEMNRVVSANSVLIYKNVNNLSEGIYSYNFVVANGSSPIVLGWIGPVNSGGSVLFAYLIPSFAFVFVVPNLLIFLALVFLVRSVEHSRSFTIYTEDRTKKK